MNRFLSFLLRLFRAPPKPQLMPREKMMARWSELTAWLHDEEVPLTKEDKDIEALLQTEHYSADMLPRLQAHEQRLLHELEQVGGNAAYYVLCCLGIVGALQEHCKAEPPKADAA